MEFKQKITRGPFVNITNLKNERLEVKKLVTKFEKNLAESSNNLQVKNDKKKKEKSEAEFVALLKNDSSSLMEFSFNELNTSALGRFGDSYSEGIDINEYLFDFLESIRDAEKENRPKYNYMIKQTDLSEKMRRIVINWIGEICNEYQYQSQTLYLTINYMDRFLSEVTVVRQKLQLIASASLFLASKYEEVCCLGASEIANLTDNSYTKEQILKTEQIVLKILQFKLTVPTPYDFLNVYASLMTVVPDRVKHLAEMLCELTMLMILPYMALMPSKIAAAALALSNYVLDQDKIWTQEMESVTSYKFHEIEDVILDLNDSHVDAYMHGEKYIEEKFSSSRYSEVALIIPTRISREQLFEIVNCI